jgi:hypothetical protein
VKRTHLLISIVTILATISGVILWWHRSTVSESGVYKVSLSNVFIFKDVTGPRAASTVPAEEPTSWQKYEQGSQSRLAILLTDPDSAWLGLAHGLKSIGVPFTITRDYKKALAHRVVLVYPMISGSVLEPEALKALSAHPRSGGTLIGVNVLGGGLNEVFGFDEAVASRNNFELRFMPSEFSFISFDDAKESAIRLGNKEAGEEPIGTYAYTKTRFPPMAVYEDGTAAITQKPYQTGKAYALGVDIGALLLKGYNNREEKIARTYVNDYEPALDVLLRLVKGIYLASEPNGVTLGTVPFDKSLSVIITHDIDYTKSLENAVKYAAYERSAGIKATYFVQTKYIRDYNDEIFFNETGLPFLKTLDSLGMELGSHSVSHSKVFNRFPLGTGQEQYPSYRPYVFDATNTYNGTVLGELRISKFLLENFVEGAKVVSFRPGELSNPYALPQALEATNYLYSSSVTANNSLTHLPFQLNYNRETKSETGLFEFPVTIEDEAPPKMGDRLPQALELAGKISKYGGSFVILIHPDVLDHKLAFEQGFVEAMRKRAWFGSLSDFGQWWSARDQIGVDVDENVDEKIVRLEIPKRIEGLTLKLPAEWRLTSSMPATLNALQQANGSVVIEGAEGEVKLIFKNLPLGINPPKL